MDNFNLSHTNRNYNRLLKFNVIKSSYMYRVYNYSLEMTFPLLLQSSILS